MFALDPKYFIFSSLYHLFNPANANPIVCINGRYTSPLRPISSYNTLLFIFPYLIYVLRSFYNNKPLNTVFLFFCEYFYYALKNCWNQNNLQLKQHTCIMYTYKEEYNLYFIRWTARGLSRTSCFVKSSCIQYSSIWISK